MRIQTIKTTIHSRIEEKKPCLDPICDLCPLDPPLHHNSTCTREIERLMLVRLGFDNSIHTSIQNFVIFISFAENYGNIEMNPICFVVILFWVPPLMSE
jgi:hypothetical protein